MDHTQKLRIKTAMIVYELESSLGNYIIENEVLHTIPESSIESIIDREKNRGNNLSKENLNLIIESSYLDEIFNFAINITLNTSLHQYMVELKQLCSVFGIFDIRNAVSHPNRPFPDCYWFRAAAIASDPLIEKLSLSKIRTSLNSALEENLNTPPDEWLYNVNWAIPNTLPSTFDHEITGLLGRDKEFKDLEGVLSKKRNNLVAIVAPGGVGKTALVLQYLKDISLNPTWTTRLSCIVFCTLKNEQLTSDGVEIINAITGLQQIKDTIVLDLKKIYSNYDFVTFEEAIEILEDENILICIDNLETLLMDSQKEFIEFNEQLPIKWKILVTSRISIDSATTVPLEPLVKRHAVNLSRNYLKKRGVLDFKQEDLERIASTANNNPLAIRLTIDLYLKGGDIISSISKSQKDIASFSYKNLIEALKEKSIVILEAIYAIGNPNRSELIEFLNFSKEDIVESINELAKTSLILRTIDEYGNDIYELSDSIKDLLLTNPKNIEVRNSITEEVKKRKAKILEQSARIKQLGLSEFDEEYIPDNIDPTIYSLVTDLNKCLGKNYNHSDLIHIKEKFNDILKYKSNDALLLFHFSRIFRALKDTSNELLNLIKAEEQNQDSPRIKLAIALRYFYNNDYLDALKYFEYLVAKGYDETLKSNKKFSFSVTKLFYLSLIYLGEYDEILDKSANWKSHFNWSGIIGVSRATALKRKIEYNHSLTDVITPLIEEILDIFNYIFETEGYFDIACIEANKIIKDMDFIISTSFEYSRNIQTQYLNFVARHYFNIVSKLRNENINNIDNRTFIKKLFEVELTDNPIKTVSWFRHDNEEKAKYDKEHILELQSDGYEIVKVYHIPEDKGYGLSSFMFADDKLGQQFYLSVNFFDEGWNRWGYIKEGDLLAIKYKIAKSEGKPYQAVEILEIDKH
jgi:DNA-binding MarR family transcriptional regulator